MQSFAILLCLVTATLAMPSYRAETTAMVKRSSWSPSRGTSPEHAFESFSRLPSDLPHQDYTRYEEGPQSSNANELTDAEDELRHHQDAQYEALHGKMDLADRFTSSVRLTQAEKDIGKYHAEVKIDPSKYLEMLLRAVGDAESDSRWNLENMQYINPTISACLTAAEASITRDPRLIARAIKDGMGDKKAWKSLDDLARDEFIFELVNTRRKRFTKEEKGARALWDKGKTPYLAMKHVEEELLKFYDAWMNERDNGNDGTHEYEMKVHAANAIAWHRKAQEMKEALARERSSRQE